MSQLNDLDIRIPLINELNARINRPKAVIEELRVHNGNAIADVVALYKNAHCYEIKGDNDKISRITEQGRYFDYTFRRITLVTTKKHLKNSKKVAPEYWGIKVAQTLDGKVKFKSIRNAKNNPNFQKDLALLTLWKDEMLDIISEENVNKKSSRQRLAELISQNKKKEELSQNICSLLLERKNNKLVFELNK